MARFDPGLRTGFAEDATAVDEYGNVHRTVNWVLTPDEYEQVKQGYRCVHCMEPFDEAFPEACNLCSFPVRAEQTRRLELESQGERWYGPSPDDPLGDEERERREWRKRTGIWLPGD